MNRKIIFDDFEIRLNKIFLEGNPTKAQIYDALHKSLDKAEENENFTSDEVRDLLKKQMENMCFTLGLSSAVYVYPQDYDKMVEWMMKTRLIIDSPFFVKGKGIVIPEPESDGLIIHAQNTTSARKDNL